jgi:hypothetical protein
MTRHSEIGRTRVLQAGEVHFWEIARGKCEQLQGTGAVRDHGNKKAANPRGWWLVGGPLMGPTS